MPSIVSIVKKWRDYFSHPSSPSPPSDIESQVVSSTPVSKSLLQWNNFVIGFCLAVPLETALLFAQTKSQLLISFHLVSFLAFLTFLLLFVSHFIADTWSATAKILEKIAVLLVATAVVVTVTIPFSLILTCFTWALYAISLIVILIARLIKEKKTQHTTGSDSTTPSPVQN
ncbi:hypothetical protein Q3G72_031749 [Acer saccharum]|nr:hypothetical protein Q3G72_031749 [Acer saccharum]